MSGQQSMTWSLGESGWCKYAVTQSTQANQQKNFWKKEKQLCFGNVRVLTIDTFRCTGLETAVSSRLLMGSCSSGGRAGYLLMRGSVVRSITTQGNALMGVVTVEADPVQLLSRVFSIDIQITLISHNIMTICWILCWPHLMSKQHWPVEVWIPLNTWRCAVIPGTKMLATDPLNIGSCEVGPRSVQHFL